MSTNPLDAYKEFDPKLIDCYKNLQDLTYGEGALSPKFKLLIALAIDVEHGGCRAQSLWAIEPSSLEPQKKRSLKH